MLREKVDLTVHIGSLSAVDAHTARHLVDKCIGGPLMENRTCVLVTHHIRLCLPVASLLIRMNGGRAEIEAIEEKDLEILPEISSDDSITVTASPTSKVPTAGTTTPVNGGLITKEHRDTVRFFTCQIMKGATHLVFVGFCQMDRLQDVSTCGWS